MLYVTYRNPLVVKVKKPYTPYLLVKMPMSNCRNIATRWVARWRPATRYPRRPFQIDLMEDFTFLGDEWVSRSQGYLVPVGRRTFTV